ncbi:MAG: helix-turn-helix domain-containing protein [Luteolibacter sp.]
MAILAQGSDYFGINGFPITVRLVKTESDGIVSHAHDVTELDHYHDFIELVMVLEGRGTHLLDGKPWPVSAGDVFVIQGSQIHSFRDRDGLVLMNIMYDAKRLPLSVSFLQRIPGYSAMFLLEPNFRNSHQFISRLKLKQTDLIAAKEIGEEISKESNLKVPGYEASLLCLLTQLITFLSRKYDLSDTYESHSLLQIGNVISILERRFDEPWELAQLASIAHLSRTSLLRIFRQVTGKSPISFLLQIRIEAAKRLLRETRQDITTIALNVGFNDSNYFSRQFRLIVGCSPRDYRKRRSG